MKKTEQKVIRFIDENKLIQKDDNLLIALSGGPDSVFMLQFLYKFKRKFSISLSAYHLNHQLRGKSADKDEKFCRNLCKSLNISFICTSYNIKKTAKKDKVSLEEAGRNTRYSELKRIAKQEGCNKIATAHNANDNAETVLLNVIKGTGLRGIAGIPVKRENIIRPVLVLSKSEILEYLEVNGFSYRTDKSNLSDDYERNYLRNKIIPLVKKRLNSSLENTILHTSFIFRKQLSAFEEKVNDEAAYYELQDGKLRINISRIAEKNDSERSEILKAVIERNFSVQTTFKDIVKLNSLMDKQSGARVSLSGRLTAFREREEVLISKISPVREIRETELIPGEKKYVNGNIFFINTDVKLPEKLSNNRAMEYISADNLEEKFILRPWKKGDRFHPLGLKGTKKVSDYLNEQKIASSDKLNQLVLTNGGKIVWIPGMRIDDRFKITSKTRKVYQLCLLK